MNDRTEPDALAATAADPAGGPDHPAADPPAVAMSVADAVEIAQTCTLAGRADLIAGFLESQATPAAVRSRLLAAQAEASPEIVSLIQPHAAASAIANPLIDAAKQLAAKSAALHKNP